MATADQIKSLIRSHAAEDRERFYSIALQVAAHEAKKGHTNLAHEIREIIDALGGDRSLDNDVGEMRRVLNALLQFNEQDQSNSIIVAATNNPKLLDKALFRRFDDVLSFSLPDEADTRRLIKLILGMFLPTKFSWDEVLAGSKGLSHAEIRSACQDTLKDAVLFDQEEVSDTALMSNLKLAYR